VDCNITGQIEVKYVADSSINNQETVKYLAVCSVTG